MSCIVTCQTCGDMYDTQVGHVCRVSIDMTNWPLGGLDKDPSGIDQHVSGAKLDAGRADLSLLLMFGKALTAVGLQGTGGKIKYSRVDGRM